MEELQSWWEVPTIAHFCYVFRAAFNLFHFEIEELEAALLQERSNEQPCATIEQLAMRLLQGCMKKKNVNVENWEELLRIHFCRRDSSAVKQHVAYLKEETPFSNLELRDKVQVLLSLCELRLASKDVLDKIKYVEIDTLRITPLGTDSKDNIYWYFFGMRLYKEDVKLAEKFSKKNNKAPKNKKVNGYKPAPSRSRKGSRVLDKPDDSAGPSSGWSVVCYTLEDWKSLACSLNKSRAAKDKQLSKILEDEYISTLEMEELEKERLKQKRMLELAPRRTSSRIDENKKQEERVRLQRQAIEEVQRKEKELEKAARQQAEKTRIAEGRASRARLRELKWQGGENSNSADGYSGTSSQDQRLHFSGVSASDTGDDSSSRSESVMTPLSNNIQNTYGTDDSSCDNSIESDDNDSGSDLTFEPSARKIPKTTFYPKKKTIVGITKIASQTSHANNRNFSQFDGLHMNGGGSLKASILYNSYKTYSILPTTPFLPVVPEQ